MEKVQLDIFESNRRAKDGMIRAAAHADSVNRNWSTMAYEYLVNVFIKHHRGEFMCEQVRKQCEGVVPNPPELKSWGAIFRRAANEGRITKTGYRKVANIKAHSTPASVWKRV